ncbi:MAG: glutamate--tRNA ligase family protein [Chloroflexota bacterium]
MTPRVAFSPSSAGLLHLSTLQTAVFAWAWARQLEGELVNYHDNREFIAALDWLGVDWDEGVGISDAFGSAPKPIPTNAYERAVHHLQASQIEITEQLRPLLTAVIANHHREISHIVAPADASETVVQQQQLYAQLGWTAPQWHRLPPLVDPQGKPIGRLLAHKFENDGYLPAALFNYLIQLVWTPPSGQAILSKWEIGQQFEKAQATGEAAPFSEQALRAVNQHYLQRLSNERLAQEIRPFLEDGYGFLPTAGGWLERVTAVIRAELYTFEDAIEAAEWVFEDDLFYGSDALQATQARAIVTRLVAEIAQVVVLDEKTAVSILQSLYDAYPHSPQITIDAPLYAALTGSPKEPPIPKILGIIGKQRALTRLGKALRN